MPTGQTILNCESRRRNRPGTKIGKAIIYALSLLPGLASSQDDSGADLAQQLQNPVSSLISVPFQFNWDFEMGPLDEGRQFKLNFQPVVPVSLNAEWSLIIRTIVPYISQEDVLKGPRPTFPGVPGDLLASSPEDVRDDLNRAAERRFNSEVRRRFKVDHHQDGLGDILQSFFFVPKQPVFGLTVGFGPALLYPTATDDILGSEKWGAGPTLVALKQKGGWTAGVLANHIWSFAGNADRTDVNSTFLQPFVSYTTKTKTTFGVNAESTYDWTGEQWLVPINVTVSQLTKIGNLPVSFGIGGRYYAEGPSGAPEWGLRLVITPLFPTGGKSDPTKPSGNSGK